MSAKSASDLPVAPAWYELNHVGDGISHIRETYVAPWARCNMWHVRGRDRDLLIDSGMGLRPIKAEVAMLRERPVVAISTHCHFDHIGSAHEFDVRLGHPTEADVYVNPSLDNTCARVWIKAELLTALPYEGYTLSHFEIRPAPLTGYLDEGDIVDIGDRVLQVFHLPGHSPGSIALYEASTKTLFSGDILYDGALIDNAWHSNANEYRQSLQRLRHLQVNTVYAGHAGSFGGVRLLELIDDYLAGGNRMDDVQTWLTSKQ